MGDDLDLDQIFEKANRRNQNDDPSPPQDPDYLISQCIEFLKGSHFNVGDLVCWKPGMRNRSTPIYGDPCIVVRKFPERTNAICGPSGEAIFHDTVSIEVGIADEDGDFLTYLLDKDRMMLWSTNGD